MLNEVTEMARNQRLSERVDFWDNLLKGGGGDAAGAYRGKQVARHAAAAWPIFKISGCSGT